MRRSDCDRSDYPLRCRQSNYRSAPFLRLATSECKCRRGSVLVGSHLTLGSCPPFRKLRANGFRRAYLCFITGHHGCRGREQGRIEYRMERTIFAWRWSAVRPTTSHSRALPRCQLRPFVHIRVMTAFGTRPCGLECRDVVDCYLAALARTNVIAAVHPGPSKRLSAPPLEVRPPAQSDVRSN